jgi:integrase
LEEKPFLTVQGATAKSNTTRHLPLNRYARQVLEDWKAQRPDDPSRLVFTTSKGKEVKSLGSQWEDLRKAAKLENFRFHDLRHTFASRLVQADVSLFKVQQLLGHSTPLMTKRYAHLGNKELAEAVAKLIQ